MAKVDDDNAFKGPGGLPMVIKKATPRLFFHCYDVITTVNEHEMQGG